MPEIQFSERELEDFLSKDGNLEKYLGIKFISRQVKTPVGIIDIIGVHRTTFDWFIIELKKDKITPDAYFQIDRYYKYFHHTKKKYFHRLLIGNGLDSTLNYSVSCYWRDLESYDPMERYYTVFGIDFDKPLSFAYGATGQMKIQKGDFSNG